MQEKNKLLDKFFSEMENDFKQEYYSGNLYNIFNELSISTDEVKHSSFLSGLLNPNGFHGCKNIFFSAFLKEIKIDLKNHKWLTDFENLTFTCEFFIGNRNHKDNSINKNAKNYGRIDILIENKEQTKGLIIENKIYAKDQDYQLRRYFNFGRERYSNGKKKGEINKDFIIYYLTLDKEEPKDISIKSYDEKCIKLDIDDIQLISYKQEILQFLEKVMLGHKTDFLSQPINSNITEVLKQYVSIIKQLTNKDNYFINKIYQSEEYRNEINENDLILYRSDLRKIFFKGLKKELLKTIPERNIRFVYSIHNDGEDTEKTLKSSRHKKNFGIEIKIKDKFINIEVQGWYGLIFGVFKRTENIPEKELLLNKGFKDNKYWIYKEFQIKNSSNVPFPFYNDFLNYTFKNENNKIINELSLNIIQLYDLLNGLSN